MLHKGGASAIPIILVVVMVAGLSAAAYLYFSISAKGAEPLYHYYGINDDHYYTMNQKDEFVYLLFTYDYEGKIGCLFNHIKMGTVPMYSLKKYIKNSENRPYGFLSFYTVNEAEKKRLLNEGWQDAIVVGYVIQLMPKSAVPLYESINNKNGAALLSTNQTEFTTNDLFSEPRILGYVYPEEYC